MQLEQAEAPTSGPQQLDSDESGWRLCVIHADICMWPVIRQAGLRMVAVSAMLSAQKTSLVGTAGATLQDEAIVDGPTPSVSWTDVCGCRWSSTYSPQLITALLLHRAIRMILCRSLAVALTVCAFGPMVAAFVAPRRVLTAPTPHTVRSWHVPSTSPAPLFALVNDVNEALKTAMKEKDKEKLVALRNIRAAFLTAMKEDGADTIADEKAVPLLRKLQKMRQESIELYEKAGREDMRAAEQAELAVIEAYLPTLADEATTRKWVEEAIAETKASAIKDFGRVMGHVMKLHKADVDGNLLKKIATEMLE